MTDTQSADTLYVRVSVPDALSVDGTSVTPGSISSGLAIFFGATGMANKTPAFESPYGRMAAAEAVPTRTSASLCAPEMARADVVNGHIYASRIFPHAHEHPTGRPQQPGVPSRTGAERFALEDYLAGRTRILSWGDGECR